MVGLRQTEATNLFAFGEKRKPFPLLLFGTEGEDGIHDERTLYADEASQAAVAAFQFLHDEAIGNVIHVGAAVFFRKVAAEETHLRHFRNEFFRKGRFFEMLVNDGNDTLIDKPAHRIPHHPLFVAEQIVDAVEVHSFECHRASQ